MKSHKISDERERRGNKIKAVALMVLAVFVAGCLLLYAFNSGSLGYSAGLICIAAILLVFFVLFAVRRYRDAVHGLPFEDERSRRVMEKAGAKSFFVSLYVLLALGWLSEDVIRFRDVSQASSITIGVLALIFFAFWLYYHNREI